MRSPSVSEIETGQAGLLPESFTAEQDLVVCFDDDHKQNEYVYNAASNTLRRGQVYFLSDAEKEREKLILEYKLQKKCLQRRADVFILELNSVKNVGELVDKWKQTHRTDVMRRRLKTIDRAISILDEKDAQLANENDETKLLKETRLEMLLERKSQIDAELSKVKTIEDEMRKTREAIRHTRGQFAEVSQISQDDEKLYERLLKAQKIRAQKEYGTGLKRVKEENEKSMHTCQLEYLEFDVDKEARDLNEALDAREKEHERRRTKHEEVLRLKRRVAYFENDRIPTLIEEIELFETIRKRMKSQMNVIRDDKNLNSEEERQKRNELNCIEIEKTQKETSVSTKYGSLSRILLHIEQLKGEIEDLEVSKEGVHDKEIEAFKDGIFLTAGGQNKGESETGFVNHTDCQPNIDIGTSRGHCLYRAATDSTVDFALSQIEMGIKILDEDDLFKHLKDYKHSAAGGKGKHANHLRHAAWTVFREYVKVERRILIREREYQNRIDDKNTQLRTNEFERDSIQAEIIEIENQLNQVNLNIINLNNELEEIELKAKALQEKESITIQLEQKLDQLEQSLIETESSSQDKKRELIDKENDKQAEIEEHESEVNKESEFNELIGFSEARWQLAHVQSMIVDVDKPNRAKRINAELNKAQDESVTIKERMTELKKELETKKKLIDSKSEKIKKLEREKNGLIELRTKFELDAGLGLTNHLEVLRSNLTSLEQQKAAMIKKHKSSRTDTIKRKVYDSMKTSIKGTTKSDSDMLDCGSTIQLFKGRRHKNCENRFDPKVCQSCKFFEAIKWAIEILLASPDKTNEKILAEFTNKDAHYSTHVINSHAADLTASFGLIRSELKKFKSAADQIEHKYTNKIDEVKQEIDSIVYKIMEKKEIDDKICVEHRNSLSTPNEDELTLQRLKSGADFVVVDHKNIYAIQKNPILMPLLDAALGIENMKKFENAKKLAEKMSKEPISGELEKLLSTRKVESLEHQLADENDSARKSFFLVLVDYFKKAFLEKRVKITELTKEMAKIQSEKLGVEQAIDRAGRELKIINFKQKFLEDLKTLLDEFDKKHRDVGKNSYELMKELSEEMINKFESLRIDKRSLIDSFKDDIKKYKDKLKKKPNVIIKVNILNENRLRLGLKHDSDCHRQCSSSEKCDFFKEAKSLLQKTVNELDNWEDNLRSPEYRMPADIVTRLILGVQSEHCKKKHDKALRRVIAFVGENYGRNVDRLKGEINLKIRNLEWAISQTEFEKSNIDEFILPHLQIRFKQIEEFLAFRNDLAYDERADEADSLPQRELDEYKKSKLDESVRVQINYLIKCLSSGKCNNDLLGSIRQVFSEYFTYDENFSLKKLVCDLNQDGPAQLRNLIWAKSTRMGAVEFILKKISGIFQETKNYSSEIDPMTVYGKMVESDEKAKMSEEAVSLESLEKELTKLQERRREISLEDTSMLREELESIESCIRYIKCIEEIEQLRQRVEEITSTLDNRDDYYSFELDRKRVCVRLVADELSGKIVEVKEIERIRCEIAELSAALLEHQSRRGECVRVLENELKSEFEQGLVEISRELAIRGVWLCGHDRFENGQLLDRTSSLVSALVSTLVERNNVYQIGGINAVQDEIEEWTRRIRVGVKLEEPETINHVVPLVNKEFDGDRLFIGKVIVITSQKTETFEFKNDESNAMKSAVITLIALENRFLSLVPRQFVRIHEIPRIDALAKIPYILSILQGEEDLFKHLCDQRIDRVLKFSLATTKNLADEFKREQQHLASISTLEEFNAIFCRVLSSDQLVSRALFVDLVQLEELIDRAELNTTDQLSYLKIVKRHYEKTFTRIIRNEQQRRKKQNVSNSIETREEVYLKKLISEKSEELEEITREMTECREGIESDENLVNRLVAEKETAREQHKEKMDKLIEMANETRDRIKEIQTNLSSLMKDQVANREKISEAQGEIRKMEATLRDLEQKIEAKQREIDLLNEEIKAIEKRQKALADDLTRVNKEKERKLKEKEEKEKEIAMGNAAMQLIKNMSSVLSYSEVQVRKEAIRRVVGNTSDLETMLNGLQAELEQVTRNGHTKTAWDDLIEEIDYAKLKEYIKRKDHKLAGESQSDFASRLKWVVKMNSSCETEICNELVNGKIVRKMKFLATNLRYSDIHRLVREGVERAIQSTEASRGLRFSQLSGCLISSNGGVNKGIGDLTDALRQLVETRIELKYPSELVEKKKRAKFTEAAEVINQLNIGYKDVVARWIDEIEVVLSGKFLLDRAESYPGVDLTISAVDMECVGDNLSIDISGRNGLSFTHKATNGQHKRGPSKKPNGDSGYDGYDGEDGDHGGNIVLRVENSIVNLAGLTLVKANGGNGGEGQLGGDGDEGSKGADGENGKAPDTKGLGGGQTSIGFGKPGKPGGRGGAPGRSGRPGLGGQPGVIEITHKAGKVDLVSSEANAGREAQNVLERSKPIGGEGGEPGRYGHDEVKQKKSFFHKTTTGYTTVNRAALVEKYPQYREIIENAENVDSTNQGAIPAVAIAITVGLPIGLLYLLLIDSSLDVDENDESLSYRDRDKNMSNKRGQRNTEAARLRDGQRRMRQDKRETANVERLHQKLSDKKTEDKEVSGEAEHKESLFDMEISRQEIADDIERCEQEVNNLQIDIEIEDAQLESKMAALEQARVELRTMRNETSVEEERIGKVRELLKEIKGSQRLRDKKQELDLSVMQKLASLNNFDALANEFKGNKEDLIRIVDDYLEAVRARLRRRRANLKYLNRELLTKQNEIDMLNRRLEDLRQERLAQIVHENEIEEEIEQAVETQLVEEITNVIDVDETNGKLTGPPRVKRQVDLNSECFVCHGDEDLSKLEEMIKSSDPQMESIQKQFIRHYISGVHDAARIDSIVSLIRENIQSSSKDKFDKQLNEIRTYELIRDKFNSLERHLMLESLIKIKLSLGESNRQSLDHEAIEFLIKMTETIDKNELSRQLGDLTNGEYVIGFELLMHEIETLIHIFECRRHFYLEKCEINFSLDTGEASECEKLMLEFNRAPGIEKLVDLVSVFKKQAEQMKFSSLYLEKSVGNFIETVVENLRYFATINLNQMTPDRLNAIVEDLNKIGVECLNSITQNDNFNTLKKICDIISAFYQRVESVKISKMSKKISNRTVKFLDMAAKKLVKYIDVNSSREPSKEIEKIAQEFLSSNSSLEEIIESINIMN